MSGIRKVMSNHDIQATWHYHNGTKHPYWRLMNPQHDYDPSQQPLQFKIYKDLPTLSLPLDAAPSVPSRPAAPRSSARRLIVEDIVLLPHTDVNVGRSQDWTHRRLALGQPPTRTVSRGR